MESKALRGIRHNVIKTQHVFSEDNQVFIKQKLFSNGKIATEKWFPVRFYWASDMEVGNGATTQNKGRLKKTNLN